MKARTLTLAEYLTQQFGSKYQFFAHDSAKSEMRDEIVIGDRTKFKNFKIVVNYASETMYLHGKSGKFSQPIHNLNHLERVLGRIVRETAPKWAHDEIKLPKKLLKKAKAIKKTQVQRKTGSMELEC